MKYLSIILFSIATVGCASSADVNRETGGGDVRAPRVIYKVDPDYPAELRRERVTGVVRIAATIDRTGRLVEPRVLRSSDSRLDSAALAAVRRWRFKPGTLDGEPVDVLFEVDVKFSIP